MAGTGSRAPRAAAGRVAAAAVGAALAACAGPGTVTPPPAGGPATAPASAVAGATAAAGGNDAAEAGVPAQIAIASSDLAVGPQRFAFAILDPSGALIQDAEAEVTFFDLATQTARETGRAAATFYPAALEPAGLYVVDTTFDRAGAWGAAIEATLPGGGRIAPQRVRFQVAERSRAPAVGDAPPPTANRTTATEPDLARLTSDPHPDPDLYAMTVDEAAASGRPTVVVFATPAFCQSLICGPVVDEVKRAKAAWGERANFIHVEVYQSFDPLVFADEMAAWGLETEPWTFVLDADGRIAARLEGSVTAAELEPILRRLTE